MGAAARWLRRRKLRVPGFTQQRHLNNFTGGDSRTRDSARVRRLLSGGIDNEELTTLRDDARGPRKEN